MGIRISIATYDEHHHMSKKIVATTLGMGIGSIDNDGMGTPLSREEVRALTSRSGADASSSEDDRPRTYEEAAEEQALVDILQGGIRRAR